MRLETTLCFDNILLGLKRRSLAAFFWMRLGAANFFSLTFRSLAVLAKVRSPPIGMLSGAFGVRTCVP